MAHNETMTHERRTFTLRQLFAFTALIGATLMITVPLYRAYSSLITEAQESSLQYGMSKERVLEILGEPDFSQGDRWGYKCNHPTLFSDPLAVGFDSAGRVNWISR